MIVREFGTILTKVRTEVRTTAHCTSPLSTTDALHLLSTCKETPNRHHCFRRTSLSSRRFRFARFETVRHSAPSESKPAGEDFPTAPKTRGSYIYKTCSVLRRTTRRSSINNNAHDRLAALPRFTPSRGHVVGAKTTTTTTQAARDE